MNSSSFELNSANSKKKYMTTSPSITFFQKRNRKK